MTRREHLFMAAGMICASVATGVSTALIVSIVLERC